MHGWALSLLSLAPYIHTLWIKGRLNRSNAALSPLRGEFAKLKSLAFIYDPRSPSILSFTLIERAPSLLFLTIWSPAEPKASQTIADDTRKLGVIRDHSEVSVLDWKFGTLQQFSGLVHSGGGYPSLVHLRTPGNYPEGSEWLDVSDVVSGIRN